MNLKKIFNSFFTYVPEYNYDFDISNDENETKFSTLTQKQNEEILSKEISFNLEENLNNIQISYNTLINSDIIIKKFTLNARGKQYNAVLLYIDGLIDTNILNNFILKPLMLKNSSNTFEGTESKVTLDSNKAFVRKIKKFDISDYLLNCLIPQNSVHKITKFEELFKGVNSRKLCSFG